MKNNFKRDNDFETGKDDSILRYKDIIMNKCENKCSDKNELINYDKIDNNLCHL